MRIKDINTGYLAVMAAAILWGTTGTAQAFAPLRTDPLTLGFFRIASGGLFLLLIDLPKHGLQTITKPWPVLGALGSALGMGFYQVFFFAALLKTGVAVGTMITIGSAPIIASLWGYLLFREKLTYRWVVATVLAIGGCLLLSIPSDSLNIDPAGVAMALLAGVCWATAGSFMKKMPPNRSPLEKTAIMLLVGSLLITPLVVTRDLSWSLTPRGMSVILYIGILATALPYCIFARGIQRVPVAIAYTITLLEPATAAFLGIVLLGEKLTFLAFSGMLLIFAGLAVLSGKRRRKASPVLHR
jgi:DME family drug/metabolite transporter